MSEDITTIAEQLRAGLTVVSFTKGTSMRPLLYEGKSYVVLKPIDEPLQIGALPLFRRSKSVYVLHRLIGIDGDTYITRGDNCIDCERTPKEQFVGVVTEIVRGGKTIHVTDPGYRRYVSLWLRLSPVRIPLYRLRASLWAALCGSYHKLRARFGRA